MCRSSRSSNKVYSFNSIYCYSDIINSTTKTSIFPENLELVPFAFFLGILPFLAWEQNDFLNGACQEHDKQ